MELRPTFSRFRGGLRRGRGLLALAGTAGLVLSACSGSPPSHQSSGHTTTTSTKTTTTTTTPPVAVASCPLTGAPVPGGGAVPQRVALAVKIDNYPDARPQSGLDKADVVFEEPVEGGITRYAAVFQCQDAPLVGPVRSARNIDIGILGQLGTPLLVHVGGIDPVLANINASPLVNIDLGSYGSIQTHPAGRVAPYDTYSTTAQMWGTKPALTTPPQPLFSYSNKTPKGTAVSAVNIDFSGTSNVTWKYNPAISAFTRFYNGTTPDMLSDGAQNTAANVIVQYVQISYGPWVENSEGGLEVQAALYPNASGVADVFRGGTEITGTWSRAALGSPTKFVDSAGTPIALQPGQTWVELVPNTITATTTP
jgi:Protein of unknown function (DUF3048) N-terminal domain/Protein of unknown function (DUF3048) C-terminal domain